MDPNQPAQSSENLPPRKEPHLPISMAETHPEIYNENSTTNSKNTFLTLASLLVLAGIVGITLYLYIQNKVAKTTNGLRTNNFMEDTNKSSKPEVVLGEKNQALVKKYGAICKKFISLSEAVKEAEVACELDLSNRSLSSLPKEVSKLTKLNTIDLQNNNFSTFPSELLNLNSIIRIDLSNNNLSSIPDDVIIKLPSLQTINLNGNVNLSEKIIDQYNLISTASRAKVLKGRSR
jgi:Leucine-rich repeat (LRR) protein